MKTLTIWFCILFSQMAFAHEDHFLGDGALHNLFHAFAIIIAVAAFFKGVAWYRSKKN